MNIAISLKEANQVTKSPTIGFKSDSVYADNAELLETVEKVIKEVILYITEQKSSAPELNFEAADKSDKKGKGAKASNATKKKEMAVAS